MKAARSSDRAERPNVRRGQCREGKGADAPARRLTADQLNRGITFVQNRSIDFISFACGTSAL